MKLTRKAPKADMPLAAIGDIVFNLLIFFVILAKAQDDSHIQWQPAETPEIENAGHTKVSVAIDTSDKLYLNGQEIGVDSLEGAISDLLRNAKADDRRVHLKVHDQSQAIRFEPVIEAIAGAGGELWIILEKEHEKQ